MQVNLFQLIAKKIEQIEESSLFLVDGTITLSVFFPTSKDTKEYKNHFQRFLEESYWPIIHNCLKKDILLVGFLKSTGSNFLCRNIDVKDLYDVYVMNRVLSKSGEHIPPIPIANSGSNRIINLDYVTFFLNLKDWNYRFELIDQQKNKYIECIENLLFWSTKTHYGMNPIFSKADEYSRVTRRDAEIMFNLVLSDLSEENKAKLRLIAKKKTHFGYGQNNITNKLTK